MPPSPILQAEFHIAGVRVVCDTTKFELYQPVGADGQPNGKVTLALLEVTLSGPAAFLPVWQQLKLNVFRRESGHLVWRTDQGRTVRQLKLLDTPCTVLRFQLDARGQAADAAAGLRLCFSPAAIELDGVYLELYSRLSWEKNAAVRRRALNQPAQLRLLTPLPRLAPPPVVPSASVTAISSIGENLSTHEQGKNAFAAIPTLAQLDLEATLDHVEYRDYTVPRKRGIGGAHNSAEFGKHAAEYVEVSRVSHHTVPGVYAVKYQIYALDAKAKPTGELVKEILPKTIYDPNIWTRMRLKDSLEQALKNSYQTNGNTLKSPFWEGETAEGYMVRGTYRDGKITTFFFK